MIEGIRSCVEALRLLMMVLRSRSTFGGGSVIAAVLVALRRKAMGSIIFSEHFMLAVVSVEKTDDSRLTGLL